ncbi:MAG: Ig-like domain-containing protein [Ruminococcus sp.]|nr:Ig-like domain-containing protein [Ruminococcus sp.]
MKKLIAILLAALMVIGCMSIMAVSAADEQESATLTIGGRLYSAPIGTKFTYTVNLKTQHKISNGEFYLGFPQSIIDIAADTDVSFPVLTKDNVVYNYNDKIQDELRFNFSNQQNPYDFTNGGILVTVNFTVNAAGTGNIGFINDPDTTYPGGVKKETVMSWIDSTYVINDEVPNAVFTEKVTGIDPIITPTDPTEPTQATQPTNPAPKTTITVKAEKTTIYVGATTTVKATVKNGSGATKFSSSKTKVATVSSTTGKVTGKAAGTTTIKATNNGKSDSVTIKVVKKANPMTVKGAKKTLQYSKVKKSAQTVKAITVKKAKGKVTYKKKSGNSKITVNKKTGKLTIKKGTKKGTYTVKVTVTAAGNAEFKKATKVATTKITIA